jgi:pyrroloquinoline quinone biosynthesis protein B
MTRLACVVAACLVVALEPRGFGPADQAGWELVVLGIAQDAGIPQLGCPQPLCTAIRRGDRKPQKVSSIGLVNAALGKSYLFDATPDLPAQLQALNGGRVPTGVFLTHGHIGHYTGLMYFGRESIDARAVPVYGTGRMHDFLRSNGPWSLLVSRRNVEPRVLAPDTPLDLGDGIRVTAIHVPHRDEFTDTVGFLIESSTRRAVYIPDIDHWSRWTRDIRALVDRVDIALLDGTFAAATEIPGRTIDDIPHPLIPATRALLQGVRASVRFIHLNHTNAEIDASDVAREGQRFPM